MRKAGQGRVSGPGFPLEEIAAARPRGRMTSPAATANHDRQGPDLLVILALSRGTVRVAVVNGSPEGDVPWLR